MGLLTIWSRGWRAFPELKGQGLSIIYAIVRNHDGQITVESEQGVGTMFRVMLPVVERDLPQTSP